MMGSGLIRLSMVQSLAIGKFQGALFESTIRKISSPVLRIVGLCSLEI